MRLGVMTGATTTASPTDDLLEQVSCDFVCAITGIQLCAVRGTLCLLNFELVRVFRQASFDQATSISDIKPYQPRG